MTFALALPAFAVTGPVYVDAYNANGAIKIDGVRDDIYSGPYAVASTKAGTDPNLAWGNLWVAWDPSALYFYIEVFDTTPRHLSESIDLYNDNVEFFIDWNAGKGGEVGERNAEDTGYEVVPGNPDGCPFWQVRVYAAPNLDGVQPLGGLILEGETGDWSVFDWGAGEYVFEDVCEFKTLPLDGNWNYGYIIEIKIPAPDGVTLSLDKQIPMDIQIIDYVADSQTGWGKKFMADYMYNDCQWAVPYTCQGIMTLKADPPPPTTVETITDEDGEVITPPPTNSTPRPPKVGDNALMIIVLLVSLAGAVVLVKRAGKNRA